MCLLGGMEGRGKAIYPNGQQYDGMWFEGKREGRGTIIFGNGAVYKGRFKEDLIEGQGTLKVDRNVPVSNTRKNIETSNCATRDVGGDVLMTENPMNDKEKKLDLDDWMIPIEFQSDIGRIHEKAGFTSVGE